MDKFTIDIIQNSLIAAGDEMLNLIAFNNESIDKRK